MYFYILFNFQRPFYLVALKRLVYLITWKPLCQHFFKSFFSDLKFDSLLFKKLFRISDDIYNNMSIYVCFYYLLYF